MRSLENSVSDGLDSTLHLCQGMPNSSLIALSIYRDKQNKQSHYRIVR